MRNETPTITYQGADRYRIEDSRGYCEFSVNVPDGHLGSFGGTLWPNSWPAVFELRGPDARGPRALITGRTGYFVRGL